MIRVFFLLVFLLGVLSLEASTGIELSGDTVKIKKFDFPLVPEAPVFEPNYLIDFSSGLCLNKTFGIHPILDVQFKIKQKKNYWGLLYEHRYGKSGNEYQTMINDTLKTTDVFNSSYVGFEFQRSLSRTKHYDLYSKVGIGYDWIRITEEKTNLGNKVIGGLGFNLGMGYTYFNKKQNGPVVAVLYHFANFRNEGGSKLNPNLLVIRMSYNL